MILIMTMIKFAVLAFLFIIPFSIFPALARSLPVASGGESPEGSEGVGAQAQPPPAGSADKQKEDKRGEWVLAPIPISSPAIGSGLEWAVGYLFAYDKADKISPNSVLGIGGLFTNNGSRGVAVGGRLYLKEDKYRVTAAAGNAKINADIYGVGKLAGDNGLFLPLTFNGSALLSEFLFGFRKDFYAGARFQYRDFRMELNREELSGGGGDNLPPSLGEIRNQVAADLFQQRTVAVGPRFQWDSRSDTYYPRRGIFLDAGTDFFTKALGSKFSYQYYKVAFNKYTGFGKYQVLAVRAMGCAAAGDHVPIYDLCLYGASSDLRGYAAGRYQDRRMFAAQAEYRMNLPVKNFLGRFGVVGFGGFGGVGNKFSEIGWGDLLPAGGGGVRFRLTKKDHVNLRADYAIGRVGHTFSMGLGEAF
jgi:hypothetical protein